MAVTSRLLFTVYTVCSILDTRTRGLIILLQVIICRAIVITLHGTRTLQLWHSGELINSIRDIQGGV